MIWQNCCFIEFYHLLIEVFQIAQLLAKTDNLVITNNPSQGEKIEITKSQHRTFFDIAFLKE